MNKIIVAIMFCVAFCFAQNDVININKTANGTDYIIYPSAPLAGVGAVKSIELSDMGDAFKGIIITYSDGTVQSYYLEADKPPTMTIYKGDRFLSWESLTPNKFKKAWTTYIKFFQA
jgi:hypothetical protein